MSSKRDASEILGDTLPELSKAQYRKRWSDFETFLGGERKPIEDDYLQYFDHLHNEKKQKASTIWTTYSMLNSIHQLNFGEKLQITFPRLTQLLKSYNANYERKVASVFTIGKINQYLDIDDTSPYVLVRKAIVVTAVSGGLRTSEMRELNFKDFVQLNGGYKVTLIRKKQNGEKKPSVFFIPANFAKHIELYSAAVTSELGDAKGAFCKGKSNKFVDQPMGKNTLYGIGKDVATTLNLPNPGTYTGHCFRRSSATIAADSGATTQQLQRAFGWKSASTAQKYVDESDAGAQAMASFFTSETIHVQGSSSDAGKSYNIQAGEHSVFNFY